MMSQRLQFFQSYLPPDHQLSPIPGIHIPLVHQLYTNMTQFPHPYMAPFAHNPQIPFAPLMYGHGPMMPPFTQQYAAPIAQNLLGPPIWYNQTRSAQAPTLIESSRSPTICKLGQTGVASRVPMKAANGSGQFKAKISQAE